MTNSFEVPNSIFDLAKLLNVFLLGIIVPSLALATISHSSGLLLPTATQPLKLLLNYEFI